QREPCPDAPVVQERVPHPGEPSALTRRRAGTRGILGAPRCRGQVRDGTAVAAVSARAPHPRAVPSRGAPPRPTPAPTPPVAARMMASSPSRQGTVDDAPQPDRILSIGGRSRLIRWTTQSPAIAAIMKGHPKVVMSDPSYHVWTE